MNTKIAWGIVALVIVAGGAYAYIVSQKAPASHVAKEQPVSTIILQGKVVGTNSDTLQITVQASSDGSTKVVTISPATRIEKVLSQKGANGATEKQSLTEVNVSEVEKGSLVTVEYVSEKGSVLTGVSRVVLSVKGGLDLNHAPQSAANVYLKSTVVSIDLAKSLITYKPYVFNTVGAIATSTTVAADTKVYRIDDPSRLSILHARIPALLADLQAGQIVFFVIAEKTLQKGNIAPEAIIIAGK